MEPIDPTRAGLVKPYQLGWESDRSKAHFIDAGVFWGSLILSAMIISSRMEGGANVVSEAIAAGTPVLASRIPGNLGLLGEDWPACYPVGDAGALAGLIARFATDPAFRARLQRAIDRLAATVDPDQERAALDSVIAAAAAGPPMR